MPKQLPHPRDYQYKLPEGYTMDITLREKLDKLVVDTGLTEAEAQKFIDLHVELTEDYAARLEEANGGQATYAPEQTITN